MPERPPGANHETWRHHRAPGERHRGPERRFEAHGLDHLLRHPRRRRRYRRRETVRGIPQCEAEVRREAPRIKMYWRAKSRMMAQDDPERFRMGCGPLTEERHEIGCFMLDRIGPSLTLSMSHGCIAHGTDRGVNTVKRAIETLEALMGGAFTVLRRTDVPREVRTGFLAGNRACVFVFRVPGDLGAVLAEWRRRVDAKRREWREQGRCHRARNRKAQAGRVRESLSDKVEQQTSAREGGAGRESPARSAEPRPAPRKGGDKRPVFSPAQRAEHLRAATAWFEAGKARRTPLATLMESIARWYPAALREIAQGSEARRAWAEANRGRWGHLLE